MSSYEIVLTILHNKIIYINKKLDGFKINIPKNKKGQIKFFTIGSVVGYLLI